MYLTLQIARTSTVLEKLRLQKADCRNQPSLDFASLSDRSPPEQKEFYHS